MTRFENYINGEIVVPKTMQALVASGKGFENLAVRQVPVPQVGPNQLLARVDAAGVCTSNIKLIAQGQDHTFINGWDMQKWPVILGDEGVVILVKIGENLKDQYKVGQRFAIQPAVAVDPINHRDRYKNNADGMHKCAVGYTLGGHLAQYICVQEEVLQGQCLLPLPDDDMSYFAASMAEPISCIFSAQERSYHIIKEGPHAQRKPLLGCLPGGVTVVVGAGAMGRIHAELSMRYSPSVLIVSARTRTRLDIVDRVLKPRAQERGVQLITVTSDKLSETIMQHSQGKGADDIILSMGVKAVQQDAMEMLAPGGVANLFGGLPRGDHFLQLDAIKVHYQEIKVVGSSGGDPSDMAATLKAIVNNDIDPGNYIAAVGSLDNAIDVLKMIKEGGIDGKAMLYPHIKQTPLMMVDHWDKQKEIAFLNESLA
jgi:threonine dehydrogenase-like Zn-dependent dehydrogenase